MVNKKNELHGNTLNIFSFGKDITIKRFLTLHTPQWPSLPGKVPETQHINMTVMYVTEPNLFD